MIHVEILSYIIYDPLTCSECREPINEAPCVKVLGEELHMECAKRIARRVIRQVEEYEDRYLSA